MFNIAIFADDISQDLDCALDVAEELWVEWIEIRSAWGKNLIDHDLDTVRQVRDAIHARGMRVRCVAAPLLKSSFRGQGRQSQELFHAQPRDTLEQQLELVPRAAQLAHLFDTNLVRCFSFWKVSDDPTLIWNDLIDEFQPILRAAEREGIVLAMENDFECNIGTGALAARFIAQINSPHLRLLWDPGNAYFAGESAPYPSGYEKVKDFIVHVHIKDAVYDQATGTYRWVATGAGQVDLLGQLRALKADGYTGVITLENHYIPPGGTKEEGLVRSFVGLRRLLKQV
ncbi:MAG: sugar phosphate isomerase/epimerase [Anaerolineae bacterium]|nr:sugar phosphate isomerase/epimerase [Anaerolineae bacterium]